MFRYKSRILIFPQKSSPVKAGINARKIIPPDSFAEVGKTRGDEGAEKLIRGSPFIVEKNRFKLVIFDLDGTLVNTLDDITDAANKTLAYFGIPKASRSRVKYAIGSGVDNFFIKLKIKQADIKKAGVQFTKNYFENLTRKSKLYPGIIDVLRELKKRKTILYVVTNKPQIFSGKILKNLKVKKYFKKIIGGNGKEKDRLKPSPYYIKKILAQAKVKPGQALIVGDGKTDILAAKNSKISSCAVLYGFRKYKELKKYHPDFYIKKPVDILKIIK